MSTPIEYRRRGQAVWLDTISSKMIHSGRLSSLIEAGSIYGVTSNPTIFGQAILKNEGDYNAHLERLAREGKDAFAIYDALTRRDIAEGADALRRGARHEPRGRAGSRSRSSLASRRKRRRPWPRRSDSLRRLGRPNVFIKVPATSGRHSRDPPADRRGRLDQHHAHVQPQALPRGRERLPATAFRTSRRRAATSRGPLGRLVLRLPRRHARRQAPRREVAEGRGGAKSPSRELSSARRPSRTRRSSTRTSSRSSGPTPFAALRAKGARVQRPLWASTGTKNPAYSDLLYVENLIGPDTVNTDAREDARGAPRPRPRPGDDRLRRGRRGAEDARRPSRGRRRRRAVGEKLQGEGVVLFEKSYDELLGVVEERRRAEAVKASAEVKA